MMPSLPCVLVLGGAGYIGSHICQALTRVGYLPVVYDNLVGGHRQAVQWGPLEVGDVQDGERLSGVFATYRPSVVVHAAGLIEVGASVADPGSYYRGNVSATIQLLDTMCRHSVRRLVFSSSAAVYAVTRDGCLREDAPIEPSSPYGRSKAMVEMMLRDWTVAHGLSWLSLRFFNAAGADPMGAIGEAHHPETHLIPRVLMSLNGENDVITIHGRDYPTPDGTAIRDYVHVCDLAEAHLGAINRLSGSPIGEVVNIGTGRGHSVLDVLKAVEGVTGQSPKYRFGPRRPGDPPKLEAEVGRARDLIGFAPRFTDLSRIVETAWRWHCGRRREWLRV